MMRALTLCLPLLVLGCAKQTTPESAPTAAHPLDERPVIGAAATFTPDVPTTFELSNGTKVWLLERQGLPLVSVRLLLPGGKAVDPDTAHGLTAMADDLLTRGAGDNDATAFATVTEQLGIDLGASTGSTYTTITLDGHTDKLDAGLDLMADMILRPRFDEDAIERARSQRLGRLAEYRDDPGTVASWVGDAQYFGSGHPLAHTSIGTAATIESFDAAALRASWSERARPDQATLVVAGAVDQATLTASLERALADWQAPETPASTLEIGPPSPTPGYYLVDNPGASQTTLRVIMEGPAPGDDARAAGELAGVVLGGTFTSRLNRLLREEKGYTYGARASLGERAGGGMWLAYTAVRADASGAALSDLLGELHKLKEGIDAAELKKAQGAAQTRLVGAVDTVDGLASTYAGEAAAARTPSALADGLAARLSATEADVDGVTAALPLDRAVIIVVGDLASIEEDVTSSVSADWQTLERP